MLHCALGLTSRHTIQVLRTTQGEEIYGVFFSFRCLLKCTHTHTHTHAHFNCASLPRELFISGDFIVLFHSYWCKAYFVCVCWKDMEGNSLLLVLIPVRLCCWDRDPGSGGVRPQAELLCVSWCGMCCVTALIRCCFSAERCLISPQRLLQLFLIARRFLCRGSGGGSSSSDGCLLRSIWFISFTVFTCLFQRVCDLISFQLGSSSLLEAWACNFPFLFESCSVLLVVSKVQRLMIHYPRFILVFERFPFGFFAALLRSFFLSSSS